MSSRTLSALLALLVLLCLVGGSFYTVQADQRAVLLRFGEVVDTGLKPGLHFKIPVVNEVRRFEGGVQVSDTERTEFLTKDKKFLIIDSYVAWRVGDVRKFFLTTGGLSHEAETRLLPLLKDALKDQVSQRTVHEVVSGQREQALENLTQSVNDIASREFGIQVLGVRIKRVDFPNAMLESVYSRMRTEREAEAREQRSEGTELADQIKSQADKQQRVILADAQRQAETLRGEGDAQAAAITGKAFGKLPEFYRFYRAMQAYRDSLSKPGDVVVLKADDGFLHYMQGPEKAGR